MWSSVQEWGFFQVAPVTRKCVCWPVETVNMRDDDTGRECVHGAKQPDLPVTSKASAPASRRLSCWCFQLLCFTYAPQENLTVVVWKMIQWWEQTRKSMLEQLFLFGSSVTAERCLTLAQLCPHTFNDVFTRTQLLLLETLALPSHLSHDVSMDLML